MELMEQWRYNAGGRDYWITVAFESEQNMETYISSVMFNVDTERVHPWRPGNHRPIQIFRTKFILIAHAFANDLSAFSSVS